MSPDKVEVKAEKIPLELAERRTVREILSSEKYLKWLLVGPLLVVLGVYAFYPLFYCLYMSVHASTLRGVAEFIGLKNYRAVLHNPFFWQAIGRTALVTILCVTIEVSLGLAIAIFLNREFRGENIIRGLCLLPLVVSPLAMSLMWKYFLDPQAGIINAMLNVIGLPKVAFFSEERFALYTIMGITIWKWLPFSIFVFLAGLRGMPKDAFEAAQVDGASSWFTFRKLTLPLLKPLIIIVVLLRVMWLIRLSDPLFGTTQGGSGTEVLDWYVYRIAFIRFDVGEGATLALISLYITIIIGVLLYRQLIKALGATR